jgi:phage terminase large subunit-like protein
VWVKANPNLDVSIPRRYLDEQVREAVSMPGKRAIVQRLNFCIWTQNVSRWITDELWEANRGAIALADVAGQECHAGLVVSSTTDLSALVLWFPAAGVCWPFFWVPEEVIQDRSRAAMVPYDQWVAAGLVTATDGNVIDYEAIRATINDLAERVHIVSIGTKRWNATQIQTQLQGDGFDVVQYGDGFASMSAPTKELARLLTEGAMRHDGNPVLRWFASNVAVKVDAAENMRPDKESSAERIDGIEALILALGYPEEDTAGVTFV